ELGQGLSEFAYDHGGKFPPQLSELVADRVANADQILFRNPTTKKPQDWLYFPGHTTNDSPDTILVACPVIMDKEKRIIWTVEGKKEVIDESEFQQRLKAQSKNQ